MKSPLTPSDDAASRGRMGRQPLGMKEIKVQFPAEMLERIDALVGDKHRSKFIRAAVAGALEAASHVKRKADGEE